MGSKSVLTNIFGKNFITSSDSQEIGKLIIGLVYLFIAHISACISVIFVNDRLPDRQKHPPVPDIILDNIPYIPWAGKAAEICLAVELMIWIILISIHKQRFVLLRRTFILAGTMYWIRSICVQLTTMPVPDVLKHCYPHPEADVWDKLRRSFDMYKRFGLKVVGSETCGDYIFSGHTTMLTLLTLFITEYAPRSRCFIRLFTWILNIMGVCFIFLCRGHYSIDVVLAFYLTYQIFISYHAIFLKVRTGNFPWKCLETIAEWWEPKSEPLLGVES